MTVTSEAKPSSPDTYTPKHLAEKILTSKAALEGERKQVTVLFADLKGSMALLADRDPEEARKSLDPVLELMMEAVHRYEGTVNQVMGDGIMALFGAPLAHEDHAIRACYAALRMQESIARYAEGVFRPHGVPLIRVGLNSGEVVVRAIGSDLHMGYTAVGQTTHLAARMEQMATPGTILLAPATLRLAEGYVQVTARGPVAVKGLPGPVEVYALTGASAQRTRLHAAAARGLTRFIGRDAEVEQIRRAERPRARTIIAESHSLSRKPGAVQVMDRRTFVATLTGGLLASPLAADAQRVAKVPRIGWLGPDPTAHRREVFLQHLRDLGYAEGGNIKMEYRFTEGKMERIDAVAAELVALNVDVIVAVSQPVVEAIQQATRTIPIVMFGVGDPVSTGLVASLARPGGNTTGLSQLSPELSAKRLALLKEVVPEVSRVAVFSNPTNPSNAPQIRNTRAAAKALGVELQLLEVRSPQDLESMFQAAARGRAGALVTLDDLFIFVHRIRILALAARSRLPGMYGWPAFPEAGGLMSYSPDFENMYRQAAIFVDKILRGARPSDLPVEQPTKFELVINLKTAKALGLTIPPSLLLRADQVIE